MADDATTDFLVLGSGMAGLTVGALLAHAGQTVRILEAHDSPGGNLHVFPVGGFRFCAQVHYVFGLEEGGAIRSLLRTLDLEEAVPFVQLDPDGYDHVVVAGERFRIPNGFDTHRDRLIGRFPEQAGALRRYFEILGAVRAELESLPDHVSPLDWVLAPLRQPHLLRWHRATLGEVLDAAGVQGVARAVLAGQAGDAQLPPGQLSFPLHVLLVSGYDRGAWYPRDHFGGFVDALVAKIRSYPGCSVELGQEVDALDVEGDRVTAAHTRGGRTFRGRTVISNIDPRATAALLDEAVVPGWWRRQLDYPYSVGSFNLYLGLKDVDLRAHGFGSYNVWRYPHADIDRTYADQLQRHDLSDPWLFLGTPSLHSDAPGLCPPGHAVIGVVTSADHAYWSGLEKADPVAYKLEKARVHDRVLDILEAEYVPGLRDHLAVDLTGTPITQERFCHAPAGNSYGIPLDPAHAGAVRIPAETPFTNLFLVNATAGWPSVPGTARAGERLFERLAKGAR